MINGCPAHTLGEQGTEGLGAAPLPSGALPEGTARPGEGSSEPWHSREPALSLLVTGNGAVRVGKPPWAGDGDPRRFLLLVAPQGAHGAVRGEDGCAVGAVILMPNFSLPTR